MTTADQEIEFWTIETIIPYPKNPKKHSEERTERLARLIEKNGVTPLQIESDGTIIAGHGRRLALIKLGRTNAPVIVRYDLTKQQCDALRIADNAIVSTEMDYDLLGEETIRLGAEGYDMADLGMTDAEIKALSSDIGEIDDSAFTSDITTAVETQKAENTAAELAIDDKEAPVGEALGFKKVTTAQSRVIRGFIARIEAETELKGAAAFVAFINSQE